MVDRTPEGDITWPEEEGADDEPPWLQVWSVEGQLLYRNAQAEARPVPDGRELAASPGDNPVSIPTVTVPIRVLSRRSFIGAQRVVIQVARSEAIQRNARVMVVFVPPSTGWTVSVDADDTVIQSRSGAEGTSNAVLTATPAAATTITFGALGSVTTNKDTSTPITQVDMTNSQFAGARTLRVVITGGGGIRMCDPSPSLALTDPRRC